MQRQFAADDTPATPTDDDEIEIAQEADRIIEQSRQG